MSFQYYNFLVVVVIVYIYYIYLDHPDFPVVEYSEVAKKFKTGDIILFHALDNINPVFIGTYYGHIGIVYIDPAQPHSPYIFEAFNPGAMPYFPPECKNGIALTSLEHRLNSYRGYCFYKELARPIEPQIQESFGEFIDYALTNLYYNQAVISSGLNKLLFNQSLHMGTNCGELVYMSLIKLGLLDQDYFHSNRRHHLLWLSNLEWLKNNAYKKPVYVMSNYFRN